jgi:hypothetical protein
VFVVALVVGILHAAVGEASGLVTSLPDFQTSLVAKEVAALTVGPPRGRFPAIPARNLHACRLDVALGFVPASERFVTAGTDESAVLFLDRLTSGTGRLDQDTCCGRLGGRGNGGGGVKGTAIDVDLERRGVIIRLGRVWDRDRATRIGIRFEHVRMKEAMRWDIPLTTAVVGDQVRTHSEFIHARGWNLDRLMDRCNDSFQAQGNEDPEPLRVHPRCVHH